MHLISPARFTRLLLYSALLVPAAVALIAATDQPDDTPAAPPTAVEIIQRHIEAVGGAEAIQRHTWRTLYGTIEVPSMKIKGEVRIYHAAPDRFLMVADLGEHGENRTGYNGEAGGGVGWTTDEVNGPTLLTESQLEELRRQADLYADLNYERHYKSMELLGRSDFRVTGEHFTSEPVKCYELKLVDRSNKDVFAYFSIESGLLTGLKGTPDSHFGPIPTMTLLADYDRFDGILLPTRWDTRFMNVDQRILITRVAHELIDEAVFELPEEVAALLNSAKDATAGADTGNDSQDEP